MALKLENELISYRSNNNIKCSQKNNNNTEK